MTGDFPDLFDWIQGVKAEDLPTPPFSLAPGIIINDSEKYLNFLRQHATAKQASARYKTGALQYDLRHLYWIVQDRKAETA